MGGDASVVDVAAAVAAASAAADATDASQSTQLSASRLLQATTCAPALHRYIWRENATRQSVSGDGDIAFGDSGGADVVVGDGGGNDDGEDTPDSGSNGRVESALHSCTAAAAATSGALQASQRWRGGEQLLAGVHDDEPSAK